MKLNATEVQSEDSERQLLSFGFYDESQTYGVGLIQDEWDENRIELMVADQSVYDFKNASILFTPKYFELALEKGTIRESDGEDLYQIYYEELSAKQYGSMRVTLLKILKERLIYRFRIAKF